MPGSRRRKNKQGLGSAGQNHNGEELVSESFPSGPARSSIFTQEWGLQSCNRDNSHRVSRAERWKGPWKSVRPTPHERKSLRLRGNESSMKRGEGRERSSFHLTG